MTWEYASLGWFVDERAGAVRHFWRVAGQPVEDLPPEALDNKVASAGRDGWELVTVTGMPELGETWHFKRPSS